jgi:hypothetical protein
MKTKVTNIPNKCPVCDGKTNPPVVEYVFLKEGDVIVKGDEWVKLSAVRTRTDLNDKWVAIPENFLGYKLSHWDEISLCFRRNVVQKQTACPACENGIVWSTETVTEDEGYDWTKIPWSGEPYKPWVPSIPTPWIVPYPPYIGDPFPYGGITWSSTDCPNFGF